MTSIAPSWARRTDSPSRQQRRMRVALVGADGAGKSTISRLLEEEPLPFPVKRIYMGVNLEASTLMLPTTRLLLAAKRMRGGRPDLVPSNLGHQSASAASNDGWRRTAKEGTRMTVWVLEEWLRQLVATSYTSRGYVVVFDRHFFADYYHADIAQADDRRRAFGRLHGWMLQHAYPKPDLVICLDAPAEVLYARKQEATPEWLNQRRQQYLALAHVVPAFKVVDAAQPLDLVFADVVESIRTHWKGTPA